MNIEDEVKNKGIDFVRLESVDLNGVSRSKIFDSDFFLSAMNNGFHCPNTVLAGFHYNGDILDSCGAVGDYAIRNETLTPDLESFAHLPWFERTGTLFADFTVECEESFSQFCCRSICKDQLRKLQELGYSLCSAFEYEFYIVNKDTLQPINVVNNFNATMNLNKVLPLTYDIMTNLKKVGVKTEYLEAEFGPSQYEIPLRPTHGLKGADTAYRFKSVVKETCNLNDCEAFFISKPFENESGCSSHFNHSLWDLAKDVNAFSDLKQPDKLSKLTKNWLAGLQEHSKALTALLCPSVNCFERIKPNTFAPTNDAWGFDNRTVAYRVKNYSAKGTYIENRIPGAGSNPYLVIAGCIVAGMDGIKRDLQLKSEPFEGNIYKETELPTGVQELPTSLEEALKCLKEDQLFVEELGSHFIKAFSNLKVDEIRKVAEENAFESSESKWKWYRRFYGQYM